MTQYTDYDLELMHDEMLDECTDQIQIGNLTYDPSDVLKSTDPVAYRCSVNEYIDCMVTDEIIFEHSDGNYYDEAEDDE